MTPLDLTTSVAAGTFSASLPARGPACSPIPGYPIVANLPPRRFKPVWTDADKPEF